MLKVMTGESIKMGIEEIKEQYSTFRSWCRHTSFDGVFYAKHLSRKGGVAFYKSVKRNIFRFVKHLLAERVTVRSDVERIKEQPSLLPEALKNLCAWGWSQNIDAGNVELCLVDEIKDGCWSIERIAVEAVNKASVKADSSFSDVFNGADKFSGLVLVFFMSAAATGFDAFYADQ